MKQIPILFSTPMVQAILNGTKTETRRTRNLESINHNPNWWRYDGIDPDNNIIHYFEALSHSLEPLEQYKDVNCPYGKVGDVLWVRETFSKKETLSAEGYETKYIFKSSSILKEDFSKWKPSIHMPKVAARIWLEITNIRVERLQDISDDDAISEGIEEYHPAPFLIRYKDYTGNEEIEIPATSFRSLWESINGPDSWNKNPFVWVIEFNRIENPNN